MFVPLHDNTRLRFIRFQYVSSLIILINIVLFVYITVIKSAPGDLSIVTSFGYIPAVITGQARLDESLQVVSAWETFITYSFLHLGWLHLLSNILFLWVFADNVEDIFGHFGFLLFYLACGFFAAFAHTLAMPGTQAPLIGASGAVSGVLAAYMLLFPRARVWVLLIFYVPLRISAFTAVAAWFAFQVISLSIDDQSNIAVAWWAHIGGFLAGLCITIILRRFLLQRIGAG